MSLDSQNVQRLFDLTPAGVKAGFRLHRLEVLNWGTFHQHVWSLDIRGENALLTGDIGSGKSTLVDAITTLLVAPQRLSYNKAAGAETRERNLKSYVLGHYKAERLESGTGARAVGLRDQNGYSVLLGRFVNEGFNQEVTLAQVFWIKDGDGPPAKMFVVADTSLSIKEHFSGFGSDIANLRKRLRQIATAEVSESYPSYASAFRRRFGIESEQALDLFHQTVSMKSVGNLTDFVRQHMLDEFPVANRVQALCTHFDDLNRAHEAVLRAKAQIERLVPLVADCTRHADVNRHIDELSSCREALRPWFATCKGELLATRLANLAEERQRLQAAVGRLEERLQDGRSKRDALKMAISQNGGDRLGQIRVEISRKEAERDERRGRAERYNAVAAGLGLSAHEDDSSFAANRAVALQRREESLSQRAANQNALTDAEVAFRNRKTELDEITVELDSLRKRKSNIPAGMMALRSGLCIGLGDVDEADLPFVGELIQVRPECRDWEGAIERVMHGFALSLLVNDRFYDRVAEWVNQTHLGSRFVYYRVRDARFGDRAPLPRGDGSSSLIDKVAIKPEAVAWRWLENEIAHRYDYACCDTMEAFRREPRAMTRSGQIKGKGERHEKDDRHRIDDRSRYVLGWSNEEKIASLELRAAALQAELQQGAQRIASAQAAVNGLNERLADIQQFLGWTSFRELDWRPMVVDIQRLDEERRALESESDVLRTLEGQLQTVEGEIAATENERRKKADDLAQTVLKLEQAQSLANECAALAATAMPGDRARYTQLATMRADALGPHTLTVESCENREKDMRDWLQKQVDAEKQKLGRLAEKIVTAMVAYRKDYPVETQEFDASVNASSEYQSHLEGLQHDDLPRFETRFKEMLNENAIREVASFQSQLYREDQTIRERIEIINKSLHEIDYNPARYIKLETAAAVDTEIREFRQDLRACTEDALTSSENDEYSERKFEQVRRLIQRFQGRPGHEEADRKWTHKVTDVRNWFSFAASECWREDDRPHEHYTDSGGKSGGQKEKLAYTVLAASIAYQFGLELSGRDRSRSFRFVVIDEAFGRGSDDSARYALTLFEKLRLQILIVTPLQKIHVIEPHVAAVGFVHNDDGKRSVLRNLSIEEYRAERAIRNANAVTT
jgi:uncharacterized protein YPO0396